ncbi:GM22733 [Drosophila sechellia]|uniref:non-specific serine/threonine protein kinase n=1 Tax=Drosophila sechellia TaxID=7238 RepID=B4I768_DROSE|nr:GM22733 [Drosophila sechellia]
MFWPRFAPVEVMVELEFGSGFEEMHEQMSGYKRMRREHQAHLVKLEEKCKVDMEAHKTALDKEYETLLHNFTRDLDRLETKHQQDVEEAGLNQPSAAEKNYTKRLR